MSNLSTRILLILIIVVTTCTLAYSQTTPERQRNYPAPVEGDYVYLMGSISRVDKVKFAGHAFSKIR